MQERAREYKRKRSKIEHGCERKGEQRDTKTHKERKDGEEAGEKESSGAGGGSYTWICKIKTI